MKLFEVADQFSLLGIDAHNDFRTNATGIAIPYGIYRHACFLESIPLSAEVSETDGRSEVEPQETVLRLVRRQNFICRNRRPTVLRLIAIPNRLSSRLILAVVFLVHFRMTSITSGVFFRLLAPTAFGPNPMGLEILSQELTASLGHSMRVHLKDAGDLPITAQLERFQTTEQTPLLFVQSAGKQNDRGLQINGRGSVEFGGR